MTTFTEKVEELLKELAIAMYFNGRTDVTASSENGVTPGSLGHAEPIMQYKVKDTQQALIAAHQAEISRVRKEEGKKFYTRHEVGDTVGQYEITDRFKKVGKNTKYRVICKLCGAPMFRYSNRFKTNHKDCPAINKIKGEYK